MKGQNNMINIPEDLRRLNPDFFHERIFHEKCQRLINCTPFVGAGMSVDLGFPTWKEFISNLAEYHEREDIIEYLKENNCDMEIAASEVRKSITNEEFFRNYCEQMFNRPITKNQIIGSAVDLLPRLFPNTYIVTTNYDHVLSNVYARCGIFMEEKNYTNRNTIGAIMFLHAPAIIKLHGSFGLENDYIFSKEQYDKVYNNTEFQSTLKDILMHRPLFFLGCSLINERFLDTWSQIIANGEPMYHYAIMPEENNAIRQEILRQKLNQYHITPIWYPEGRYDLVRTLLEIVGMEVGIIEYNYPPVPFPHSFVERRDENNTTNLLKIVYGETDEAMVTSMQDEFQNKFIYITGLGGIGKTTLMNRLYYDIKDKTKKNLPVNIKIFHMTFLDNWTTTLKTREINIKQTTNHYILFVDNLPNNWHLKEDDTFSKFASRCQIFVTSRDNINKQELQYIIPYTKNIYYINLGWAFPVPEDLFIRYFASELTEIWQKNKAVHELVKMAGGHTLTIEILANHARERCGENDYSEASKIMDKFVEELKLKKFDLSELCDIENLNNKATIYKKITHHLEMLVNMDELSESETDLMEIFAVLAESAFHPHHIRFEFKTDCMNRLIQLGWVKKSETDDYFMHEIVKKLVYDKEKNNSLGYLKLRNLVHCLGKTLEKRSIEKAGSTVFEEMDNINHAQSLYDYFKRILPENKDIDILDDANPYNDNDFAELANNLFSSYDDIDMRDKAFDGSVEAESLSRNTHDRALYTYAVSANSIGYLCVHSKESRLPDEAHLTQAFSYFKKAEEAIGKMFGKNYKEANILKGKILSNIGAYYNACLKLDIELIKQNLKTGKVVDTSLKNKRQYNYDEAIKYHQLSLKLREELYSKYGDEDIKDYIFTSKENIANDHYQAGKLVDAVRLRLSFLPDFQKYYGDKPHIKKFVTLRNIGDTCKSIVVALRNGETVAGASKDELPEYEKMAIQYLEESKRMREAIDNHKDIIRRIDESLHIVKGNIQN